MSLQAVNNADLGLAFAQMAKALGYKNDPPLTPAGPYSHGQFGLFNMPGSLRTLYSAIIQPAEGLANDLPVLNLDNAPLGYNDDVTMTTLVTGLTAGNLDDVSNQPTTACGDAPVGGMLKLCTIANPYGFFTGATEELSLQQIGRVVHRDEPVGFNVANDFLGNTPVSPSRPAVGGLEIEVNRRFTEMVLSFQRMIGPLTYTSNSANTVASGYYKQFNGMDLHINENNKRDAYTSSLCTAANSIIKDANYQSITDDPEAVFRLIEDLYLHAIHNASTQRLMPVQWKFVMRRGVWYEVARNWPVAQHIHSLNAMAGFTNGRVTVTANEATAMTNAMIAGQFIPLMGQNIPVVIDDFIDEDNVTNNANLQAGEFSADIYLVPYTVMGGRPVTGWTFWNWNNIDIAAVQAIGFGNNFQIRDGGRTLLFQNFKNGCLEYQFVVGPRLLMMTPQIAGRVQNVKYVPQAHLRSWDPDSQYFYDGGRTTGVSQSYYHEGGTDPLVFGVR